MTPIKILAIVGPGGARMDFIAGWAGTLPNFYPSHWGIDPLRRQSTLATQQVLDLMYPPSITGFLESQKYMLDSAANLTFAIKSHQIDITLYPLIHAQTLKVCHIDITNADIVTLAWEFVIKTYLRPQWPPTSPTRWGIDTKLSPGCTDQQRIEAIDQQIKFQCRFFKKYSKQNFKYEYVDLKYVDLFSPGGSRYFCKKVDIFADDSYHNFYDLVLPLSQTPDEVSQWGHVFCKKDYITD